MRVFSSLIRFAEANEYHGHVTMFCDVKKNSDAQFEFLTNAKDQTLLLCYPPPNSMALKAIRKFSGSRLIYVGEWYGDTANSEFQKELLLKWRLRRVVALPCMGNTNYSALFFERKSEGGKPGKQVFGCSICGAGVNLRRCRFSCAVVFCSEECMKKGIDQHREQLVSRHISLDPARLLFSSDAHFQNITLIENPVK